MKKTMLTLLALMMCAGTAMAIPYSANIRPVTVSGSTLQTALDANLGSGVIDVANDQNSVGAWKVVDSGIKTYGINFLSGSGRLGIYSFALDQSFDLITKGQADPAGTTDQYVTMTYNANDNTLVYYRTKANGVPVGTSVTEVANFGDTFAFYWLNTGAEPDVYSYTMDMLNGGAARALTYVVPDGTNLQGALFNPWGLTKATGNDDWIMAFEKGLSATKDFADAVFYMTDLTPVPEPGTLLLLGSGLVGLAYLKRRKQS